MYNKGLVITCVTLCSVIIGLAAYLFLWADDVAYKKAVDANTVESYKEFTIRYTNSEYITDVRKRYAEVAYKEAVITNTEKVYKEYLNTHKNSLYVDSIKPRLEKLVYERVYKGDNIEDCQDFVKDFPNSKYLSSIQKKIDRMEKDFYNKKINISIELVLPNNLTEYNRLFPDGKYSKQVAKKQEDLRDYTAFSSALKNNTKQAFQYYLDDYPKGLYASKARSKIKEFEEFDYYKTNSLSNGAQPYAAYYGRNYSYDYGRAYVEVKASSASDVLVVVRYNNSNGRVAGHTYVKKNNRATIYLLPDYKYQVFFYYGTGWYPKKEMKDGIKGGFLLNESFDKDGSSMYLGYGQGVTYTLTQVVNGNFSTSHSNANEFF